MGMDGEGKARRSGATIFGTGTRASKPGRARAQGWFRVGQQSTDAKRAWKTNFAH